MKRDFSEAYKQKLIQMIRQNENEKWCDFTDWLGDRLLDFSDWIGLLDLYGSISGAEAYTKAILDKNNTSIGQIERIFDDVKEADRQYGGKRIADVKNRIQEYDHFLVRMSDIVNPSNGKFDSGQVSCLLTLAAKFKADLVKIKVDADYSEEVYHLLYDKQGKKKKVGDITNIDKDKIIQCYEDTHPKWKEELNKILKSGKPNTLTEEDTRNIKFIAYTAEEPYRTIYLDNVERYKIGSIGSEDVKGAFYRPDDGKIYFQNNQSGFSRDPRGAYTTFFHESGHATDYKQESMKGPITESYQVYNPEMGRKVTLQEAIYFDVYNDIEHQIRERVEDEESVQRILDTFRFGKNDTGKLSVYELTVRNSVVRHYDSDLAGERNEAACDVYGGVTNLEIGKNGYGHRPNAAKGETIEDYTYWYDKSGKQTYAQSRELWAEYFSYCMTGNEEALESLREHFPEASKVLDSIAEKIRSDIE